MKKKNSAKMSDAAADTVAAAAPATATAATVYRVGMTCDGCVGAVRRILSRFPAASAPAGAVEIDLAGKTVTVRHEPGADTAPFLAALQKWGAASGKEVAAL
jgi:copper chaperone CopZ